MLWRFLRLSSTNWPAATAPSSTRHCRLVSAYIGRTFTRRARADRGRSSVCRECPGFQKCVDQGLKFPRHNGVGHHLKGEDAMCLASSRNSAAVATGVLLTGSRPLVTASLPAAARNGMVSRTCASMVSTARRSQASARCRHCSRVLDGMAQRASLLVLRAGARIAAAGARKGSNWRYLNLGVTIPCRNTERTPVQQLRVREPPGSQPPRRQVVVAHPVVLAPTAADGLEHRVGNQHDLTHRPGGLDPVSSSALPARPPHPSCRMRARIWRSVRSRHAGAAPPSRYRSQVIRRNHDGKALNGSSRASAGVGRGSLP